MVKCGMAGRAKAMSSPARPLADALDGEDGEAFEDVMPECFFCPISYRLITSPVCTPQGHTYERDAILSWLNRRRNQAVHDPKSPNVLLTADQLVPNRALKEALEAFVMHFIEGSEGTAAAKEGARRFLDKLRYTDTFHGDPLPEEGRRPKKSKRRFEKAAGEALAVFAESTTALFTSFGFVFALITDATIYCRGAKPRGDLRVPHAPWGTSWSLRSFTLRLFAEALGVAEAPKEVPRRTVYTAAVWSMRLTLGASAICTAGFLLAGTLRSACRCARTCFTEAKCLLYRRYNDVDPDSRFNNITNFCTSVVTLAALVVWGEGMIRLRGRRGGV